MPPKCKRCGEPIVKFPIKSQPEKSLGDNFKENTINWINLFKIDMMSLIFFICLLLIVFGFKHDVAKCEDVITNPCTFCNNSGCCDCMIWSEDDSRLRRVQPTINPDILYNLTDKR